MWLVVDGDPVHVNCREPLTAEETEALIEVLRAARKRVPIPKFAELARRLHTIKEERDLSLRDLHRRLPRWSISEWSRMLNGTEDSAEALAALEELPCP